MLNGTLCLPEVGGGGCCQEDASCVRLLGVVTQQAGRRFGVPSGLAVTLQNRTGAAEAAEDRALDIDDLGATGDAQGSVAKPRRSFSKNLPTGLLRANIHLLRYIRIFHNGTAGQWSSLRL